MFGAAFFIEGKIAETLELITQVVTRIDKTALTTGLDDFERVRIQRRFEVAGSFGFRFGEKPVVKADLGFDRTLDVDPMDGAFYLPISSCTAAFAFQICRTA